ncbi:MAG: GAF domain-containing protein [Anaerolineae bacterium]
MVRLLSNLRIGPRLAVGFGVLVLMVLFGGFIALYNNDQAGKANAIEAESNQSSTLALEIDEQLLEARRRESDFLLNWQREGFENAYNSYIVLNQQHTQNIRDLTEQLRDLIDEEDITLADSLDQIDQATISYDNLILTVTSDLQRRGFVDTGLEGEFRTAIHSLEAAPPILNSAELTVSLLEMRRNEKDYLLRGLQVDIDDTANFTHILEDQINALPLTADEKASYINLAEDYLNKFNALVAVEADAKAKTAQLRAVADSISPLIQQIVTDELAQAVDARAEIEGAASVLQVVTAITLVVALVIGSLFAYFVYRSITRPIQELTYVAEGLSQGDYSRRAELILPDETGALAQTLNNMATEIQTVVNGLEIRTRDLQTVSEVSARVSTILEPERLLRDVADLTKERFGLYHAHIYLLNDAGDTLVLTAGAGYVGRQMVSEHRTINMENFQSIVANAARSRKGVIVNDVRQSPTFLPHPLLPDTRSELAVPLVARGQLLGVLDVQSDTVNYFNENNLTIIELMASQISTAISNASLYETAARTARHERALGAIERKVQGALSMDEILQTGVRELGKALRAPYTAIEMQLRPNGNGAYEEEAQ